MDSVSQLIVILKNAAAARKKSVAFPHSKLALAVAELLMKEGYLKTVTKKGKKTNRQIELELNYDNDEPRIRGAVRLSKPSRRVYSGARDIRPVLKGFGTLVISTPKGIVSGEEAKRQKVGGELLFKIW